MERLFFINPSAGPDMSKLPPLQLRRGEERRLRGGHLWIYSNEIDTAATPLSGFEAGQQVEIRSVARQWLHQPQYPDRGPAGES